MVPMFGEFGFSCCLPLLPQLAMKFTQPWAHFLALHVVAHVWQPFISQSVSRPSKFGEATSPPPPVFVHYENAPPPS